MKHESWLSEDWAKVLWSDESTFIQFQQSRTCRVWKEPADEWSLLCVSATVKHSPSRMHWGYFSRQGLGPIVPLQGSATGITHVEILRKYVVSTMWRMFPNGDELFQEDNAAPHRLKIAAAFRVEKDLHILS